MEKILLLAFTLLILSCQSHKKEPAEEVNVLFIGNSLTYYHDMPQMVQSMLNETNPNIKITQSTFPGMSLTRHLENIIESRTEGNIKTRKKTAAEKTETEKTIASKKWDVIILQDGTVRLLIPESRELQVNRAIKQIKKMVNNPDSRFLLFSTWPSKTDYPKEYCYLGMMMDESLISDQKYCSPKIENVDEEIELINNGYEMVAKKNNLEKTQNGEIFYNVSKNNPEIELLEDSMHPSELGAFLNACIFYQILTDKKATGVVYSAEIEPRKAVILKKIAENNYR